MSVRKTTVTSNSLVCMPHSQTSPLSPLLRAEQTPVVTVRFRVIQAIFGRDKPRNDPTVHRTLLLIGSLLWGLFSTSAQALPPLVPAADLAQNGLQAWWKPGELMVGMPNEHGRPGMRPLVDLHPKLMPENQTGWTLLGESCPTPTHIDGVFCGHRLRAEVAGDALHPTLRLLIEGRAVAENLLGRPALICDLHIGEADSVVGPELIVSWRPSKDSPMRGYTVYRIPEALHPTCDSPPN